MYKNNADAWIGGAGPNCMGLSIYYTALAVQAQQNSSNYEYSLVAFLCTQVEQVGVGSVRRSHIVIIVKERTELD